MNLKLVKKSEFEADDLFVKEVSEKLKLNRILVELLFSRGYDDEDKINKFLHSEQNSFYDPFLLKGMAEAVERLNRAIENNEKIVIYGDYDADGICACAIISLYLSGRGLDVYTHIPNRAGEGYGLSIESLEKIIESVCPDLILTCDCGISAYKEVEFANELGVEVIITDHHEIAENIPDCIVINPKLPACNYPINYLCGAGVALKLVEALGGTAESEKYLDLAAVATIADLVPLLDENRLIVQRGLKLAKKNTGLSMLLKNQQLEGEITSSDIAFKIAPRINAAGRMGDAYRAFELLVVKDVKLINQIIDEINEDNIKRKILCDTVYDEAIAILKNQDIINTKAIILQSPNWEKGITGIIAARISNDFKRPSFILVNSGDHYKGTSRSIQGVNLYELLSSVSDILIEFGGHSQAAGFSIKGENIEQFQIRINKYLNDFSDDLFLPSLEYDLDIDLSDVNTDLALALTKIEPFGNSNLMPVFRTKVNKLNVSLLKNNFNHTNIVAENGLSLIAFNFFNNNQFLMGDGEKELAVEIQHSSYNSKNSAKAIIKNLKISSLFINNEVAKANFIKYLAFTNSQKAKFSLYDRENIKSLIDNNIYGTLIIAGSSENYEEINSELSNTPFLREFMYSSSKNNYSRIMVSPVFDSDLILAAYNNIIFVDYPVGTKVVSYINSKTAANVYLPSKNNEKEFLLDIETDRQIFGKYFDIIRRNSDITSNNIFSYFKVLSGRVPEINLKQFIACFMVFNQLGFLKLSRETFKVNIDNSVKAELTDSEIYCYIKDRVS